MIENETMAKTTWMVDQAHSKIQFSVKHLLITNATGNFNEFSSSFKQGEEDFSGSEIEFTALAKSINTGIADRDAHLRSADFFDADNFPELKFVSSSFTKIDDENYILKGDFTIRNITKPIELMGELGGTVIDPWGNQRVGFELSGVIDRFDYDLKWNALTEAGGAVVGSKVKITCVVEFIKQV